ncbi:hypothetical protein KsCSTR_09670 [Candidatus Kuenenia stuttgartiensis]|uniref:Uncharacterized protein n=1 Tax=Kuenenia stuttgartiensis TaxID=174633 RepID=A0A6G7GLC5_KUEST|nr:hypothetical protein KsCSTR_09670 [Candidatus Kuenenia stuttgartiensis]
MHCGSLFYLKNRLKPEPANVVYSNFIIQQRVELNYFLQDFIVE